jgi:hypothetical protein
MRSLLIGSLLLDVEVLDLVGGLVDGDDVQELAETVPLEVLLGEVLEVSLGEGDVGLDGDFLVVAAHLDLLSQFAGFAVDFDSVLQELGEVGCVEDLVLDGLGAVDDEGSGDLGLSFLGGSLSGLGGGGVDLSLSLFRGHRNIFFILLFDFAFPLPSRSYSPVPSPSLKDGPGSVIAHPLFLIIYRKQPPKMSFSYMFKFIIIGDTGTPYR